MALWDMNASRYCPSCGRSSYAFVGPICEDCDNDIYNDVDEEYGRD
mgnify:CR=1 FL=1